MKFFWLQSLFLCSVDSLWCVLMSDTHDMKAISDFQPFLEYCEQFILICLCYHRLKRTCCIFLSGKLVLKILTSAKLWSGWYFWKYFSLFVAHAHTCFCPQKIWYHNFIFSLLWCFKTVGWVPYVLSVKILLVLACSSPSNEYFTRVLRLSVVYTNLLLVKSFVDLCLLTDVFGGMDKFA